jgi:hypothetical protein
LTFLSCLAALALVLAGAALMKARQTAKRFDRLSESYWELRYEYGQLASRLGRLEPRDAAHAPGPDVPVPARGSTTFVPLSSLKRD